MIRFLRSLYGIWNQHFFYMYKTGICLQTDTVATLILDLAIGVYPLLLMAVTYVMIGLYDSNFKSIVILRNLFK